MSQDRIKREVSRFIGVFIGCMAYVAVSVTTQAYTGEGQTSQLVTPLGQGKSMASALVEEVNPALPATGAESGFDLQKEICNLSNVFTPEVQRWKEDLCRWSEEHEMDADLIATIMQIESCGNHQAISATGVRGLFQVTGANLDGEDPYDPDVSMAKGPGKVLKNELIASKGNVIAALAGYNGGGKARQYINGEISYNQFYWFLRNHSSGYWWTDAKARAKINEVEYYAQWANIYEESKESDRTTLNRWLDAGGQRLCTEASQITTDTRPRNRS